MKKFFLLASILIIVGNMSFAQDVPELTLDETVISTELFENSTRNTARNINIITKDEIKKKGAI